MQARNKLPDVNDVPTLQHFFPCLDQSQLIDTKGGIVYTPQNASYNTSNNTFIGADDTDEARKLDAGSVFDFGTDSFGVVMVADIKTINALRASAILLGGRAEQGSLESSIFLGGSTFNPLLASGFNDINETHYTARHLNTVSEDDTYIFQLTCDREAGVIKSKVFNITTNRFDTYSEISILPMTDATFNSGGLNPTQIITSSTDLSGFIVGANLCTRQYIGSEANLNTNLTVATSALNALTVDAASFTTASGGEAALQDGVTSLRKYPDYPNIGNQVDGSPVPVDSAASVTPESFMKMSNMALYGAAYYSFKNGIPSDWDFGSNWQAWAWVQGYRVPYPAAVEWR